MVFGVPSFEQVLRALAPEIVVERAVIATETRDGNPAAEILVESLFGIPERLSHTELKQLSRSAALVVRTGEASPYANVILRCGVPF